jgi:glycosyltransferase involved in cell wall biosynthesis
VPYSFTIHGGGLAVWKFRLPYLLFFRMANNITGVSHPICDEYKKRTKIDIKYLPPLIPFSVTSSAKDILRLKYNFPPDKRIILFVGSLKPLKVPLQILNALHILGKEYIEQNKLLLIYAGDGILKKDISKYAEDFNLKEYIFLLGNIPNESIHELYTLADLYVICSEYEGTPISLLEAMFHSLPVLASDAPGINSILKHNESAIMYKTDDPNELADGLKQLLNDPAKEKLISNNAYNLYIKSFDYKNILSEYIKIIEG